MKIVKVIFKVIGISIGIFILLLILVATITQTDFFKNRLRTIIVSSFSTKTNAQLHLGPIRGNLVTGIEIDSLAIDCGEVRLISTGGILVEHDPLALLKKSFSINRLVIQHPSVTLMRPLEGEWNFSKLIKPSEDASHGPFDWKVVLNDLEIQDGSVTILDFASLTSPDHRPSQPGEVEYHNLSLRNVNIHLSARISGNEIIAVIGSLSFSSVSPQFQLSQFSGEFTATQEGISGKNITIETAKSSLQLSAAISGLNIFTGITLARLQYDPVQLQLNAKNIDFAELKSLLAPVNMLYGSASLDLDAGGEFGNLNVKHLNVRTYSSALRLAGTVKNLHQPDDLYLDVLLGDCRIDPQDAARLLPGYQLPTFEGIGQLSLIAQYIGKPLDFKATTSVKGEHGSFDLSGHMRLPEGLPQYELTFSTNRLNAGAYFNTMTLASSLSTHGEITGRGFSLDSMTAHAKLSVDSGTFRNVEIRNSHFTVDSWPRRFQYTASVNSKEMNADTKGKINLSDPDMPKWEGIVSLSSFDLSTFFEDLEFPTDLSLTARVNGSGKKIDDVNTDVSVTILPSTVNQQKVARQDIHVTLDQRDFRNKHLSVQSAVANLDLDGQFDLDFLAQTLWEHMGNAVQKILQHSHGQDTLMVENAKTSRSVDQHRPELRQQDCVYHITIKNLEPLANIFGKEPFNATGELRGIIKGTDGRLSLTCGATIDECFAGTINHGILLRQCRLTLAADSLTAKQTLGELAASVDLSVQSGLFNSVSMQNLHCALSYRQAVGAFAFNGIYDSLYSFGLSGKLTLLPGTYVVDVETTSLASGSTIWENENDLQFRLNSQGLRIMHATMRRGTESAALTGSVDSSGQYDVNLNIRNFLLAELDNWLQKPKGVQHSIGFSGTVSTDIHLTGTAASPTITSVTTGTDISYKQTTIGNVSANMQFGEELAKLNIIVKSAVADTAPHLFIQGTLPLNLAFNEVGDRFPPREQHIEITSQDFNINALESLFPELENLNGQLVCDILLTGTPRNPIYKGTVSIGNAQFTFMPNNIRYIVSGELEPSGEKLSLRNFIVRNIPEDRPDGEARINGTLRMQNFQVDSLELNATGRLLVMSEATRQVIQTMYGTLFIAFDSSGLGITGTLKHPKLSGKILIRDQNMTFPPTQGGMAAGSASTLTYIIVDDSSKLKQTQRTFTERFYATRDTTSAMPSVQDTSTEPSLLQRLDYDLTIETQGPSRIRMPFASTTNEELYALLDGKVYLVNDHGTPNMHGIISISKGSYYNFLKRFDATGDLQFTGPWDNPELKITATYEGVHQTDSLPQNTTVELDITGTRYQPSLVMSMKVQLEPGKDPVDWATQSKGGDVQSDAISFIMTGKFKDELTSQDKASALSNYGQSTSSTVLSGFTTSFLSGVLTDFMRKEFPFIRTAEVSYSGGSLQESADLRLSGEAFKGYWRFGGKILNDIGNANVNYQLNLGDVFSMASIRNLFIELEHKVEGSEFGEDRRLTNTGRIYYRLSF